VIQQVWSFRSSAAVPFCSLSKINEGRGHAFDRLPSRHIEPVSGQPKPTLLVERADRARPVRGALPSLAAANLEGRSKVPRLCLNDDD
jgi:hypothetical protein